MTPLPVSRRLLATGLAVLALAGASPVWAQRDPIYAAARAAGQIGEKSDGYLGIVSASTPELRKLVDDLNIKRRAVYSEKAQTASATVEEYAFTSGCRLIAQTALGEKYEGPDGAWKTRTSAMPDRDPRCP